MRYTNYRFQVPEEKIVRLITNTDAKNEADDQFAIVHALLSPKIENVGMIAAHYGTDRHADSMEQSYHEIEIIFEKMKLNTQDMLFHGASHGMTDTKTPIPSEGADLIIREAMKEDSRRLFVAFMGPLTDMASAYLLQPEIRDRLTVIWIGGGAYPGGGAEFNLGNDIHAANVVLQSGMEVWQIPKNVYEMLPVSLAELELKVAGQGEIGDYLFQQLIDHSFDDIPRNSVFRSGETWVLGDSPAVGMLLYEHRFEYDLIIPYHISQDMLYEKSSATHKIRVYRRYDSRLFLEDFFSKLALFARKG
ncbi:MAG: nucleoside hydrolase [Lachnospiraceae bacterium]